MTEQSTPRGRWPTMSVRLQPNRWWFFPPLLAGLIALVLTVTLAPGARRSDGVEQALPVRVMIVDSVSVTPKLEGYGEIRPRQRWQAVAQLAGKIAWRHPDLQVGATFAAGTRLIEIELLDYEVARSRADAQLSGAVAAEAEVASRSDDLAKAIAIEERSLAIAETRYQRNLELSAEGHLSKLQLDAEERELLRQQRSLQNLRTEFNLLPTQRSAASARVAEARAGLEKAREDLNRTGFVMPFDGRIADFDADSGQFVPAGKSMLTAESTRAVEVLLEVPYEELVTRFPSVMVNAATMADPGELLQAKLEYQTNLGVLSWRGRVSRIDTGLSPDSRSARVYVDVDLAETEPAPATNLYVEVEISGPVLEDQIVIPRLAWHAGSVLTADADNRLRRQPVTLAFAEGSRVVINSGLQSGQRVILSDVLFPAEGMAVSPLVIDEALAL